MADSIEYPHEELMKKAGLKLEDLDSELQIVIKDFNDRKKFAKKDETITKLQANSALITQNLYDYYVEDEEQSVVLNEEPTEAQITKIANEIKEEIKEEEKIETPPSGPTGDDQATQAPQGSEPVLANQEQQAVPSETTTPPAAEPANEPPANNSSANQSKVSRDEAVIEKLFNEGRVANITRKELKAAGLNTGWASKLGASGAFYGKYKVTATSFGSDVYNISLK